VPKSVAEPPPRERHSDDACEGAVRLATRDVFAGVFAILVLGIEENQKR